MENETQLICVNIVEKDDHQIITDQYSGAI